MPGKPATEAKQGADGVRERPNYTIPRHAVAPHAWVRDLANRERIVGAKERRVRLALGRVVLADAADPRAALVWFLSEGPGTRLGCDEVHELVTDALDLRRGPGGAR